MKSIARLIAWSKSSNGVTLMSPLRVEARRPRSLTDVPLQRVLRRVPDVPAIDLPSATASMLFAAKFELYPDEEHHESR